MMRSLLLALLFTSVGFAQDPNTTIDYNVTEPTPAPKLDLGHSILEGGRHYKDLEARVKELEAELNPTTNEFPFPGDNLLEHLANEHLASYELERLHERLHQKIEKVRPEGVHAFIAVEATDEEWAKWEPTKAECEKAGWAVVRMPLRPGVKILNIVAIGKTHYPHVGQLTTTALAKIVDRSYPRHVPIKPKRSVRKIVMTSWASGCPSCEKWKQVDKPLAEADGFSVEVVNDHSQSVPRFRVCDGDRCREFVGYLSWRNMKAAMQ